MCVLYVNFGSKTQNLLVSCHELCSVVYFMHQITLICRRVGSEQSASCFVWI